MPLSASATSTALSDTVKNPVQTNARSVVHVTLVFDGVNFNPANLYSALDAQWGTVATEKDDMARGNYVFNITT